MLWYLAFQTDVENVITWNPNFSGGLLNIASGRTGHVTHLHVRLRVGNKGTGRDWNAAINSFYKSTHYENRSVIYWTYIICDM